MTVDRNDVERQSPTPLNPGGSSAIHNDMSHIYSVKVAKKWSFRQIEWKNLIRRQDHAGLILIVVLYVATGIVSWTVSPRVNDFYLYDGA